MNSFFERNVNVESKLLSSGELVPVLLTLDNNVVSLYVKEGIIVCNTS